MNELQTFRNVRCWFLVGLTPLLFSVGLKARESEGGVSGNPSNSRGEIRNSQIDTVLTAGRMGPLQAEYLKLLHIRRGSASERRNAIREWRRLNGAALEVEQNSVIEARRANANHEGRERARAEDRRLRRAQIDIALAAGRMGPLQAEYLKLLNSRTGSAFERRNAIREWRRQNGAALKVEQNSVIEVRRANANHGGRERARAEHRRLRRTQIDLAVASGRMGALEAEYLKLLQTGSGDAAARRAALHEWRRQNGEALRAEQEVFLEANRRAVR